MKTSPNYVHLGGHIDSDLKASALKNAIAYMLKGRGFEIIKINRERESEVSRRTRDPKENVRDVEFISKDYDIGTSKIEKSPKPGYVLEMSASNSDRKKIILLQTLFKGKTFPFPVLFERDYPLPILRHSCIGTGASYGKINEEIETAYITFSENEKDFYKQRYDDIKDNIMRNIRESEKYIIVPSILSGVWSLNIVGEDLCDFSSSWKCYKRDPREIRQAIYGMPLRFAIHPTPERFKNFLNKRYSRFTETSGVFYVFISSFSELKIVTDGFFETQVTFSHKEDYDEPHLEITMKN